MAANESERLKFGKPLTFSQALIRLPLSDNPLLPDDQEMLALAFLRSRLEEVNSLPSLDSRLADFSREDMKLLEQIGFRRGKELISAGWRTLDPYTAWGDAYELTVSNCDDKYTTWRVTEMVPHFTNKKKFRFICIHTNPDFSRDYWEDHENSRYKLGLVRQKELNELVTALKT